MSAHDLLMLSLPFLAAAFLLVLILGIVPRVRHRQHHRRRR